MIGRFTRRFWNTAGIRTLPTITIQLELAPFTCMIRAKVKPLWIAARTEARRGIGFRTLKLSSLTISLQLLLSCLFQNDSLMYL